ncbi:MAG: outer membrane protein assembly factor BamA, partial [Bacteroidetes bacterium]
MYKIVIFIGLFLFSFTVCAQIKIGLGGNKTNSTNNANSSSEIDYNNPKDYTIADITVTGVQFLNSATMISMTGLRVGDKIKIPSETISNAIRKLWKPGLIGDVKINVSKIEGENVFLNIALKERPRLSRYEFKGIPKGQIQTLSDKIKLIRGRMINDAMIKNTQNTIENYFAEKGFKNVAVKISQRLDTVSSANNWVYLLINVDKKEKVKIHDIEFVGAEKMKKSTLLGRMKKTKIKNAFRIFTASKFIKTEFEKDKESIIKYYNKQGYRNALIESDCVYVHDNETVNIRLKIVEGKQFFYRKIKWTGNYVYNEKQLSEVLGIEKGDIYDPEDLDKRLSYNPAGSDISSLYQDDGYLFFNIQPIEIQVDEDSVDVEMR